MSPANDEAPTVAGSRPQGTARAVSDHCAPSEADHKAEATLQARAALAGCCLYRLADGAFLLTRWGFTKACPDLRAVSALLDRMAGAA